MNTTEAFAVIEDSKRADTATHEDYCNLMDAYELLTNEVLAVINPKAGAIFTSDLRHWIEDQEATTFETLLADARQAFANYPYPEEDYVGDDDQEYVG